MAYKPRKRKSRDNPYTLGIDEINNIHTITFKDNKNIIHKITVSYEVFKVFDDFELKDISQMHEFERHIEHLEMGDEMLNNRMIYKPVSIEEQVEKKILNEKLKEAISKLPDIQKQRLIKYYFDNKNEYQIAKEEGTTQQSVHIGLDRARKKLEEILKNYKN